VGELNPLWTDALLWEAGPKYCELVGELNKPMVAFVVWFVAHYPELKRPYANILAEQGISDAVLTWISRIPQSERHRFFGLLS